MLGRIARSVACGSALLLILTCNAAASSHAVERIDGARFGLADRETPPPDSKFGEWVTLPDRWNLRRPDTAGIGWYRLRFEAPARIDELWAIYVPSSSSSFEIFVAGERLGPASLEGEPNLQNWHRPEYFELPAALLKAGIDSIDLRLWARQGSYRGLGVVEVGPARMLLPRYRSARFWHVEIGQLWRVLAVALALFAAGLWAATGRNPLYACFVWLALAWLAPATVQSLPRFPGSFWAGQWLIHVGLDQMAIAAVFLCHRLIGVRRPRLERILLIAGFVAAAILALSAALAPRWFDPLEVGFHVIAFTACVYLPVLVVRNRTGLIRAERMILIAFLLLVLFAASHDLAVQIGWWSGLGTRWMPHAAPLIVMWFFVVLITRFLSTYRRAQQQNVELEARFDAKTQELEEHYAQLDALRRAGVLADERTRMTREMHDGMGAQLVTLLSLVESGSVDREVFATALRESIDELRLVIHSLDPAGSEVGTLLGMLRERLAPRIDHAGLRFDWRVGTSGDEFELSPERSLHLVRIVQEAITNVLKHAQASSVEVATEPDARDGRSGVVVRISDDGVGFRAASDSTARVGRGIENMQQRAAVLEGTLRIEDHGSGTVVELWLPEVGGGSGATGR